MDSEFRSSTVRVIPDYDPEAATDERISQVIGGDDACAEEVFRSRRENLRRRRIDPGAEENGEQLSIELAAAVRGLIYAAAYSSRTTVCLEVACYDQEKASFYGALGRVARCLANEKGYQPTIDELGIEASDEENMLWNGPLPDISLRLSFDLYPSTHPVNGK